MFVFFKDVTTVYYVQPLYIHIMFKKMSKLYPLGTKTKKKCEDENILIFF